MDERWLWVQVWLPVCTMVHQVFGIPVLATGHPQVRTYHHYQYTQPKQGNTGKVVWNNTQRTSIALIPRSLTTQCQVDTNLQVCHQIEMTTVLNTSQSCQDLIAKSSGYS